MQEESGIMLKRAFGISATEVMLLSALAFA
jgi:hypothetical protein